MRLTEIKFENLPFLARKNISKETFYTYNHSYFQNSENGDTFYIAWDKSMNNLIRWDNDKKEWR